MPVTGIDDKTIIQVCVIVRDVELSATRYAEILGFEMPDEFHYTLRHDHTQATYYGQPTDARAKIIGRGIGSIHFELLQPLDPQSTWHDFLEQHGEGIHHVAFLVPETAPAAQSLVEHGYTVTQQGLFTGQGGRYTYFDTDKDLGIVIELLEVFGGSSAPGEAPSFPADAGIGTNVVVQVGIMVNDIEKTRARYSEVFGIPLPPIQTTPGYDVVETTYLGSRCDGTAKLAFMNFGQVTIELIEPDPTPSVWRDWLNEHGEGAHHIAFQVGDSERVVAYLGAHGIPVSQWGYYGDRSGKYTYMDTQAALSTTVELLESFRR